jgi:hypothetical protein
LDHYIYGLKFTENIAKFVIARKYGIMPSWNNKKGDIVIDKPVIFKQIEVKGFTSYGTSSFGPKCVWDLLYFVDGKDVRNKNFKVYEVKLSDKNFNINISKNQTMFDQKKNVWRPRCAFYNGIKSQLGDYCKLIFDGNISELDNSF